MRGNGLSCRAPVASESLDKNRPTGWLDGRAFYWDGASRGEKRRVSPMTYGYIISVWIGRTYWFGSLRRNTTTDMQESQRNAGRIRESRRGDRWMMLQDKLLCIGL